MRNIARILGLTIAAGILWGCGQDAATSVTSTIPGTDSTGKIDTGKVITGVAAKVLGSWFADTAQTPPASLDTLLAHQLTTGTTAKVDTTRFRYTMTVNADSTFSSVAKLYVQLTGSSSLIMIGGKPYTLVHTEWVDSIYSETGVWRVSGDTLVIQRTSCHRADTPYVALRYASTNELTSALMAEKPVLKAAPEIPGYVCSPVESRAKIQITGGVWPVSVTLPVVGTVTLKFKTK
jgi:hypothetical protein